MRDRTNANDSRNCASLFVRSCLFSCACQAHTRSRITCCQPSKRVRVLHMTCPRPVRYTREFECHAPPGIICLLNSISCKKQKGQLATRRAGAGRGRSPAVTVAKANTQPPERADAAPSVASHPPTSTIPLHAPFVKYRLQTQHVD